MSAYGYTRQLLTGIGLKAERPSCSDLHAVCYS
jgi:hypothetical protein